MCFHSYIPRQTLSIQMKKMEEHFWNKVEYICIFCLFLLYFDVID